MPDLAISCTCSPVGAKELLDQHGRYQWQRQLSKSIFGEVVLALDTDTGSQVAIKLSNSALVAGADARCSENPRRELLMMRCVGQHENVVGALDAFTVYSSTDSCCTALQPKELHESNAGTDCLVMPYCSGGDLFDLVNKVDAWTAFLQIVRGLQHIHASGLAHLDLSLENVLVDGEGVLKICDFGAARKADSPCSRVGKMFYMAPEIMFSQLQSPDYDSRTGDMYSLGVCLFILATGFQPYEVPSSKDASFSVLTTHGVRALLRAYGVHERVPEHIQAVLEHLMCPASSRIDIDRLQAVLSTCSTTPV